LCAIPKQGERSLKTLKTVFLPIRLLARNKFIFAHILQGMIFLSLQLNKGAEQEKRNKFLLRSTDRPKHRGKDFACLQFCMGFVF
jgi:hypothetical protein